MYINILIPTDGSELAGKAVQHGIDLAKRIGAKATVLTVLPPFMCSRSTRRCSRARRLSTKRARYSCKVRRALSGQCFRPSRSWRKIAACYARADHRRAMAQLLNTGLPFLLLMAEDVYKICADPSEDHLRQIQRDAQALITRHSKKNEFYFCYDQFTRSADDREPAA